MLSKQNKITRPSFPHYKEQKTVWSGSVLCVQSYKTTESKEGRQQFAVVVSKKQSVNAVNRNSFKRHVLRVVHAHIVDLNKQIPQKHIVFPKIHLKGINKEMIEDDVLKFISKK